MTKTAQHTPGERRAIEIKSSKTIYYDHEGKEVRVAAFVLAADNKTVIGRFAKLADAQLDAAALELYAESKRNVIIMQTMLEYLQLCNPESVHTVTLEGQIKATGSAIAKARGGAA